MSVPGAGAAAGRSLKRSRRTTPSPVSTPRPVGPRVVKAGLEGHASLGDDPTVRDAHRTRRARQIQLAFSDCEPLRPCWDASWRRGDHAPPPQGDGPPRQSCDPATEARACIAPHDVAGPELGSHLGIALALASGIADVGLGLRAGVADLGLDFIPLTWESYDITLGGAALGAARPIITALRDRAVRASILRLQGYDLDHAGALTALN